MPKDTKNPLHYHPAKVSWAVAEFIDTRPTRLIYGFVIALAILIPGALFLSFFFTVPVKLDLSARVRESEAIVITPENFQAVRRVLVVPDQRVTQDQPIFEMNQDRRPGSVAKGGSPVTGIVIQVDAQGAVTVLPETPSSSLTAEIPAGLAENAKPGQSVKVWLEEENASNFFAGKILEVRPILEDDRRHFRPIKHLRIQVESDEFLRRAYPGQNARVEIITGEKRLLQLVAELIL